MYGIKRVNHTLWIRQRVGLDQFATTRAAEIGLTPTVPFFRRVGMKEIHISQRLSSKRGTVTMLA